MASADWRSRPVSCVTCRRQLTISGTGRHTKLHALMDWPAVLQLWAGGMNAQEIADSLSVDVIRLRTLLRPLGMTRSKKQRSTQSAAEKIGAAATDRWERLDLATRQARSSRLRAMAQVNKTGRVVACENCGKERYKHGADIKRVAHHFCSRRCASLYKAKCDPEGMRLRALTASAANKMRDTSIEVALQRALTARTVSFRTHWLVASTGLADIFIEPNIVVYADGDYWHKYPHGLPKDHRINATLKDKGYVVLRFWERDINADAERCVDTIMEALHVI